MEMLGFPPAEIEKARAEMAANWGRPADAFAVHPDNVATVRLFLAMATRWDTVSLNTASSAIVVRTGLKYEALELVARLAGIPWGGTPDDFARMQLCEAEALTALREQREQAR